ncbi:GNAT family N-acetyltransferase [Jatrophihabitans fulvus]
MTEGPKLGVLVERRPAEPRDTALLRDLFAESHDDLLALPPETRDLIVDMRFRALRRRHQQAHPGARRDLLVLDGIVVGQLLTAEEIATVHLLELDVRPAYRGRGLGGRVLADLLADADATRRVVRFCACDISCESAAATQRWLRRHGFAGGTTSPSDLVRRPGAAA